MRRRKDARVRSSAGQVGSHGVRKSLLASRSATHSEQSVICGTRSTTSSPATEGVRSEMLTVRKNAMYGCDGAQAATERNAFPRCFDLRRLFNLYYAA